MKPTKKHSRKPGDALSPKSESRKEESKPFSVNKAWEQIFSLNTCVHILIMEEQQKKLKIVVTKHVTQEYPWRQVFFGDFLEHYIIGCERESDLLQAFQGYGDETPILLGYVPQVTQHLDIQPEGDPFIFFISSEDTKEALKIIKEMEAFEYTYYRRNLVRIPKRWSSMGSDKEVNLLLEPRVIRDDSIEAQSIYPVAFTGNRELSLRLTDGVRDGYVELVPPENAKFDNVIRKRIGVMVQTTLPRVEMDMQTTPTFPVQAFAQTVEIVEIDDDTLDKSDSEEDRERGKPVDPNRIKPPLVLSRQVKNLLKILDFTAINFYRDDYIELTTRKLQSTQEPEFKELICFANIEKTQNRYICATNWYPSLSGLVVVSYAFGTLANQMLFSAQFDPVKTAVLEPKPVLLWSFTDNLHYKMEFNATSEVTSLAFCPYDSSVLIGGCKNGQVCIWDLQNRIETMDQEEILTASQAQYRRLISEFLKDTIIVNEDAIVPMANISDLSISHLAEVTGIYFLGPQWYVNQFGKFYKEDGKTTHRAFLTCSFDGGLYFWDLTQLKPKKDTDGSRKAVPKALSQSESKYKRLIFVPLYRVVFAEPICALSADTAVFKYLIENIEDTYETTDEKMFNYATKLMMKVPKDMRKSVVLGTFYGHLGRITWSGVLSDEVKEYVPAAQVFAKVHDGPVLSVKKSPFLPEIFISIGRTIFAIWKDDYWYAPIISRRRGYDLTCVSWSTDRPAVFFLTRGDGNVEVWDILARDDSPCLVAPVGGGTLTQISEHGPKTPFKILGIGDYNSSFRMVKLPAVYCTAMSNELEDLRAFILKEERRKRFIKTWEEQYYEKNKVLIDAKRQAQAEAQKEMDRLEKLAEMTRGEEEPAEKTEEGEKKEEGEGAPAQPPQEEAPKKVLPYPQRMALQWEELNRKRVLHTLLARMQMDTDRLNKETAMEKQRMAYEEAKKATHVELLKSIYVVVEQLRACLLPEEIIDTTHYDLIKSGTDRILETSATYDEVADECREIINLFGDFGACDLNEFLDRGSQRRRLINKSLGSNTQREYWYEQLRTTRGLDMGIWGYQYFTRHYERPDGEEGSVESDHYDFFGFSSPEELSEEEDMRSANSDTMNPVD